MENLFFENISKRYLNPITDNNSEVIRFIK